MLKKSIENSLKYWLKNEIGMELRKELINFIARDSREEFKKWLYDFKANEG